MDFSSPFYEITFLDGAFYLDEGNVYVTSNPPQLRKAPHIIDAFNLISSTTVCKISGMTYAPISTSYYEYNGYTISIGQTFDYAPLTITAFKGEKLVGFSLVNPYISLFLYQRNIKMQKSTLLIQMRNNSKHIA
jgi:hypothetical protein